MININIIGTTHKERDFYQFTSKNIAKLLASERQDLE